MLQNWLIGRLRVEKLATHAKTNNNNKKKIKNKSYLSKFLQ